MNASKVLVICFAVLAALGITGIAVAAPPMGVNTSEVTSFPPPTSSPTPTIAEGDIVTPPATVTPTVTATISVTTTQTVTATAASNEKVANAIANHFGVPLADVLKQHNAGIGYGELVIAYNLAKGTGKTVDEILAMKRSGQGWGQIAKSLDIKPGKWGVNLGQIVSGHTSEPSNSATPPSMNADAEKRSTNQNKHDDKNVNDKGHDKENGKSNNGKGKGK